MCAFGVFAGWRALLAVAKTVARARRHGRTIESRPLPGPVPSRLILPHSYFWHVPALCVQTAVICRLRLCTRQRVRFRGMPPGTGPVPGFMRHGAGRKTCLRHGADTIWRQMRLRDKLQLLQLQPTLRFGRVQHPPRFDIIKFAPHGNMRLIWHGRVGRGARAVNILEMLSLGFGYKLNRVGVEGRLAWRKPGSRVMPVKTASRTPARSGRRERPAPERVVPKL